jgi:hypothetical protein
MPANGSAERPPDDRLRRASSTPWLLGSIIGVSGILDHPLSRMMTAEREARLRDLAAHFARRFAGNLLTLQSEGAGNAGCALHPRSRVQTCAKKRTRAYRFSGGNPAFPAQWFYGLYRALPGDEFVLVTVGSTGPASGFGPPALPLTQATCARTTRLCRPLQASSSGVLLKGSRVPKNPPCRSNSAPDAFNVHRIPPRVRDDREPPL